MVICLDIRFEPLSNPLPHHENVHVPSPLGCPRSSGLIKTCPIYWALFIFPERLLTKLWSDQDIWPKWPTFTSPSGCFPVRQFQRVIIWIEWFKSNKLVLLVSTCWKEATTDVFDVTQGPVCYFLSRWMGRKQNINLCCDRSGGSTKFCGVDRRTVRQMQWTQKVYCMWKYICNFPSVSVIKYPGCQRFSKRRAVK